MAICYLNGQFVPLDKAAISPLDRGFLFGDGVYEVIPVYATHPFAAHHHLKRLARSLDAVGIETHLDEQAWQDICRALLVKNPVEFGYIYIQITRGVGDGRSQRIPKGLTPTIFAYVQVLPEDHSRKLHGGIRAVTMEDTRQKNCHIKAITLLANAMSASAAQENDGDEPILVRDGYAIESSSSNLFVVKDGVIRTTPLIPEILAGITRHVVVDLARQNHIPVEEVMIPREDLFAADEVWLTSSTREIAPVIMIDQQHVGSGEPGPMWKKMHALYQAEKEKAAR